MRGMNRAAASVVVLSVIGVGTVAAGGRGQPAEAKSGRGTIERIDAALDRLIPRDSAIEKVSAGFILPEGPVWVNKGSDPHLVLSDIRGNVIYRWSPKTGLSELLKPVYGGPHKAGDTVGPNGTTVDREGRVVFCEMADRRISRLERDGRRTVLASHYQGKRLNAPNDLVYRSDGWLYFTDPFVGIKDPAARELDFNGINRVGPSGDVEVLSREKTVPNGIAFSPDETRLYIGDTGTQSWKVYDVDAKGALQNGRVFYDPRAEKGAGPVDGLKVDEHGNLWASGLGRVFVINPDGRLLGAINLPEVPNNVAFGGEDGKTLYIPAHTSLYRIRLSVRGASLPGY